MSLWIRIGMNVFLWQLNARHCLLFAKPWTGWWQNGDPNFIQMSINECHLIALNLWNEKYNEMLRFVIRTWWSCHALQMNSRKPCPAPSSNWMGREESFRENCSICWKCRPFETPASIYWEISAAFHLLLTSSFIVSTLSIASKPMADKRVPIFGHGDFYFLRLLPTPPSPRIHLKWAQPIISISSNSVFWSKH